MAAGMTPPDSGPFQVLWVCGPAGVGKTAVGWRLHSELIRSGVRAGYVDIDQLGMCFPARPEDPYRFRLQARNLAAVALGHRAAGAECLVVSGVTDVGHGLYRDELRQLAVTACRLRADPDELARRLTGRQGNDADLAHVLAEAAALDATGILGAAIEVCVDTTGLTVPEVSRQVRDRLQGWPVPDGRSAVPDNAEPVAGPPRRASPDSPSPAPGQHPWAPPRILWLCGPTGVGTSTVGFQVFLRLLGAGQAAAFLDLDQLGFCAPAPGHAVKAANLAAVWRNDRAAGAQSLVMVGPVENRSVLDRYAAAVPESALTVVRLHAGRDELARRIELRGRGRGSWVQPGDPLLGQPVEQLHAVADAAARHGEELERAGIGHPISTDGLTPDEIAELVMIRVGWPGVVDPTP